MMPDLTTEYMGLSLSSPVIAGSSPLTASLVTLRALVANGAAAVVLPTLFQEVIRRERDRHECLCDEGAGCCHEVSGSYFPDAFADLAGVEPYLRLVANAREVLSVPVIASICGATGHEWGSLARRLAEAGAHAIELNMADPVLDMGRTGEDVETDMCHTVKAVKDAVGVPVAVKVGASFTSFVHAASRLAEAGADALVLFQRVHYPDVELPLLRWRHELPLEGGTSRDARQALTCLAALHGRVGAGLAATGGVRSTDDVVKCILAGADAVMIASAPMLEGPPAIKARIDGLRAWLRDRGFESVGQARGLLGIGRVGADESARGLAGGHPAGARPIVSDTQL
ncbi:MAG: diguanylate cyclase [Gemmatimonadota bacterium]